MLLLLFFAFMRHTCTYHFFSLLISKKIRVSYHFFFFLRGCLIIFNVNKTRGRTCKVLHICLHDKKPLSSVKSCYQLYQFSGTWPYCNQPEKHIGLEYIRYYTLRYEWLTYALILTIYFRKLFIEN